jgi:hypothetical protein
MEEDVLGPRQTVIGPRYDACTRCGQPVPRTQAATPRLSGDGPSALGDVPGAGRPAEATREAPPPILCPTCAADIAAGEPLEPDELDLP